MIQNIPKHDILYEYDFLAWCERTVVQLKAKDVENLDFENLIDKIESLGKSERRELRNRLLVLIAHILKRMHVNSQLINQNFPPYKYHYPHHQLKSYYYHHLLNSDFQKYHF
jgi:hypothetical protein